MPRGTENDLISVNDGIPHAVGEITHRSERLLVSRGDPIHNVLVEIWQVDNNGVYLHTRSNNHAGRDKNFQGFVRFLTGSAGEYYFLTGKLVLYRGRTRHIHFALKRQGSEK